MQFKLWKVPVDSIVIVGSLTLSSLLRSMCDLLVTQINVQHNIICEFMLYEFDMSNKTIDETKKHLFYESRSWSQ